MQWGNIQIVPDHPVFAADFPKPDGVFVVVFLPFWLSVFHGVTNG
jgi:hypothetical protein